MVVVVRPTLASTSPAASFSKYSPGLIGIFLPLVDGVVDRHQLGAIGKRSLHLHLLNHLRDAFHHLVTAEDGRAKGHDFGYAFAIAGGLHNFRRDDGNGLRIIQLQTAPDASAPV